ncbi:hypothetical protein [Hoylesella marshii]|uniref:hypothetical protein n=1 Tax=Hoylesella marshii TaxID=189722 RepID=UPI0028D461B2|nr:hypothetical protein [Hoylesella marshii]
MKRYFFICTFAVIVCISCTTEREYTRGAYFVFDNSIHQDHTLASAMNPFSPGIFCSITRKTSTGGGTTFVFSISQGTPTEKQANAIDEKRTMILGYNEGLIVGYGNLDIPPVFYVYDRECPNCFNPDAIPMKSYPLRTTDAGLAVCNTCHRAYNMNARGVVVKGEAGKALTRYRGHTTGAFGILTVN